MPLLRPEVPAKKKAAIHAKVKRSKFAVRRHGRTWLSHPMTRLTLQQGDASHCLARRLRPDAGGDEEDVKPRPPPHAVPAPPVKPRPPPHPQTAAFRAILPRQGRARLHHGANSLREGWARRNPDHPRMPKMLHFEPFRRGRGGPSYITGQTASSRGGPSYAAARTASGKGGPSYTKAQAT